MAVDRAIIPQGRGLDAAAPFPASQKDLHALLLLVKSGRCDSRFANRRAEPRFPVEMISPVRITHPGGSTRLCSAFVHEISERGLGLIHPGFIHPTSACAFLLNARDGARREVEGEVVWSRHLSHSFHTSGVRLRSPIDPRRFAEQHVLNEFMTDAAASRVADMKGKILCVDDGESDLALLAFLLADTGLEVITAKDKGAAIDAQRSHALDMVITDLHLGETTGSELIADLRGDGFSGPILMVTVETRAGLLDDARRAGASDILVKPYTRELLLDAVRRALELGRDGWSGSAPIHSDLPHPGAGPIRTYVEHAHRCAETLEHAVANADVEEARRVCQARRGTGAGFGFQILSDAASEGVRALDASFSTEDARPELLRLVHICRRMAIPPA